MSYYRTRRREEASPIETIRQREVEVREARQADSGAMDPQERARAAVRTRRAESRFIRSLQNV